MPTSEFVPSTVNMDAVEALAEPLRKECAKTGCLLESVFLEIVKKHVSRLPTPRLQDVARDALLTGKRPKVYPSETRLRLKATLSAAIHRYDPSACCLTCHAFIGHRWPLWKTGEGQGVLRPAYCCRQCANSSPQSKAKRASTYMKNYGEVSK